MTDPQLMLTKKVGSYVAKKFATKIIERWTRYRAERFFEGFVESVGKELDKGTSADAVDDALEAILDDEQRSGVLFDAYRSVCFSKSKELGPRVIGLLTGYLVAKNRGATETEDAVFRAAESLSDGDLIDLLGEFRNRVSEAQKASGNSGAPKWSGDALVVPWHEETRDSAWPHSREEEIEVSPLNFDEVFGPWAGNVARVGLLTSRHTEREVEYQEDSERHIDQDGVLKIYASTITFEAPCRLLCDLLDRAL